MCKTRKGSNTYCTIDEIEETKKAQINNVTENKNSNIEKELDTIQKLVNSLKKSSKTEKSKLTEKLKQGEKGKNRSAFFSTNISNKDNVDLGQDQNNKNANKNVVAKFNVPKVIGSNKCKNQSSTSCSSKKETGTNEERKTQPISLSSHTLNNITSYGIINSISPVLKTETTVHTQNNIFVDNDSPFRLMRSQSTSTCSALYSPLLKGRQNNDLRFHQQKGRYSDTICSRYDTLKISIKPLKPFHLIISKNNIS